MNLETLFPEGKWDESRTRFLVRRGYYYWPVALLTGEEMVLTALGRELAPKTSPPPPEAPGDRPILRRKKKSIDWMNA